MGDWRLFLFIMSLLIYKGKEFNRLKPRKKSLREKRYVINKFVMIVFHRKVNGKSSKNVSLKDSEN